MQISGISWVPNLPALLKSKILPGPLTSCLWQTRRGAGVRHGGLPVNHTGACRKPSSCLWLRSERPKSVPKPPVLGFTCTGHATSPDTVSHVLCWPKTGAKLLVGPWAHWAVRIPSGYSWLLSFPIQGVPQPVSLGDRGPGRECSIFGREPRAIPASERCSRHTLTSEAEAAPIPEEP